jgi:putative thioredoxin
MKDASKTNWVIDVGDDEFEEEVAQRSLHVPVVIDFWAEWCGPCKTLGPILEKLAREKNGSFVLAKVNIDEAQQLAGYFQIESIPTVVAIRNAEVVDNFVGLLPEDQLRAFVEQLSPSEVDQAVAEAAKLEGSDPTQAENMYRLILNKEPDRELARVGLARLLIQQKKFPEASELLAPLGTSGEVGAEVERLRRLIEVQENAQPAGDEAGLRKKIDADPENAKLRYELGALLTQLGRYPEALEMLLSAAERDKNLGKNEVRELMVKIFQIIGVRSEMADDYRAKLQSMLY